MTFRSGGPGSFDTQFTWGAPQFKTREERLDWDLKVANDRLRAFTERPTVFAAVIELTENNVTISTGPQMIRVRRPMAMKIEPGDVVRMVMGGGDVQPTIAEVCENPPQMGPGATVKQVFSESSCEVIIQGQSRTVLFPASRFKLKANDNVLLDFTTSCVVANYGAGDASKLFTESTGVSWDDVGGLEDVKATLREIIEDPIEHKELYARFHRRPTRGVLLHGPSGTGKTLLAAAAATALAKIHNAKPSESGYIYVRGPEVLNKFVGASEGSVRALFASAREHKARAGYPAIIFIDEADAIMGRRGRNAAIEGMERTIVPQFLAELDGLEDAGCMILLATNRPDILDPAITRRGRIDRKVHVRRPNEKEAEHIFSIYLKNLPIAPAGTTAKDLAEFAAKSLFDDKHRLYIVRTKSGKDVPFTLKDLASGAEIAGIVDDSAQRALRRERDAGSKRGGVRQSDIYEAIVGALTEQKALAHEAELEEFLKDQKIMDAIRAEKVRA